jgi:hypothetical protein
MEPDKVIETITGLLDAMRSDMAAHSEKMNEVSKKCDAVLQSRDVDKRRMDADEGEDPTSTLARQTAADAVDAAATNAAMIRGLANRVDQVERKQNRPMKDLNAFADAQAKADSVMRAWGTAAEPPMSGEDLVAYQIRLHRKMQKHSPAWKGVELGLIAADQVALGNALEAIRADAMKAAMSPVGMPEFQYREVTQTGPGGHKITSFLGNGTIFKQMSRPVRHVAYIGPRWGGAAQ